jgi:methyl-accepting chemotaxis protein
MEASLESSSLVQMRAGVARFFVIALWLHLPLLLAIGLINDSAWPAGIVIAALAAGLASAAWYLDGEGSLCRYVIAIALVTMVSLMVWLAHGQMQIDMHMYYFAAFAVLAAFCDWQVIVLAAGVTALHHLSLNSHGVISVNGLHGVTSVNGRQLVAVLGNLADPAL